MRMKNPLFLCEDPACEAEFTILDADLALSDNLLSPTTYLPNTKKHNISFLHFSVVLFLYLETIYVFGKHVY